jgi:predicted permease
MRLPILRGREIAASDDAAAPGVVIISEKAARLYWPGGDALGKHIAFDDDKSNIPTWLTVIGVAKDAKQQDWTAEPHPEVYLAALQNRQYMGDPGSHMAYITLVVRTSSDPAAFVPLVKNTVWSIDRNLPVSEVFTMEAVVANANAEPRFEMLVLGAFAGVALILAAVGIYGLMSYSVARRTHEIGIRISLGASRNDVFRLVVRQGMVLALVGSAAGIAGAVLLSRLMVKVLYGIRPIDPITFAGVILLLTFVALAATYIPARRAMQVDPLAALRHE